CPSKNCCGLSSLIFPFSVETKTRLPSAEAAALISFRITPIIFQGNCVLPSPFSNRPRTRLSPTFVFTPSFACTTPLMACMSCFCLLRKAGDGMRVHTSIFGSNSTSTSGGISKPESKLLACEFHTWLLKVSPSFDFLLIRIPLARKVLVPPSPPSICCQDAFLPLAVLSHLQPLSCKPPATRPGSKGDASIVAYCLARNSSLKSRVGRKTFKWSSKEGCL